MKWIEIFNEEEIKQVLQEIKPKLEKEYEEYTIYPPKSQLFNAFKMTEFEDVKVVILGQDPYHNPNQAHGLAFSVENKILPKSLINIFKELKSEYPEFPLNHSGNLSAWAKQGVLLLNTGLSVRKNQPTSHADIGWQKFTDLIIEKIAHKSTPVVFILWGNHAKSKMPIIQASPNYNKHLILHCAHPSPLSASRGFFGCGHFKYTNDFLKRNNMQEIDWSKM